MTPLTKTQSARLVEMGLVHETFHHATLGHFNITLLRRKLEGKHPKLYRARFDDVRMVDGIEADAYSYLIANREIDYERVEALTDEQVREPLLFALCPAGANGSAETYLLLDGIHRMVARRQRGKAFFRYVLVPLAFVPRVDMAMYERALPWGEKEVVEGVGLVPRKAIGGKND